MWVNSLTLLDLTCCSRFQADSSGITHWNALMPIVGYVKNTLDYGLTYFHDADLTLLAYVDADYGGCRYTRRSTSGYVFIMEGGLVTWSSK